MHHKACSFPRSIRFFVAVWRAFQTLAVVLEQGLPALSSITNSGSTDGIDQYIGGPAWRSLDEGLEREWRIARTTDLQITDVEIIQVDVRQRPYYAFIACVSVRFRGTITIEESNEVQQYGPEIFEEKVVLQKRFKSDPWRITHLNEVRDSFFEILGVNESRYGGSRVNCN